MTAMLQRLWNDESGQGLPEYALLVAAVVVMVVAAATMFEDDVSTLFEKIGNFIKTKNEITSAA